MPFVQFSRIVQVVILPEARFTRRRRVKMIFPSVIDTTQLAEIYESHSARVNPNSRPNLLFIITSWISFGWAVKVFEGVGGWRGSRFYIYLFCEHDWIGINYWLGDVVVWICVGVYCTVICLQYSFNSYACSMLICSRREGKRKNLRTIPSQPTSLAYSRFWGKLLVRKTSSTDREKESER